MEPGSLHVRIGRRGADDQCALLVRIFGLEGQFDFEAPIRIPPTSLVAPIISPEVVGLIVQVCPCQDTKPAHWKSGAR
jgi:hypothetical protein